MNKEIGRTTNWWMVAAIVLGLCLVLAVGFQYSKLSGPGRNGELTRGCIEAATAQSYVGQTKTVCGQVVDSRFAAASRRTPTFLNLDRPFPNHVFTVVIWGADRAKFGNPEVTYRGKNIKVTGLIGSYRGKAQIIVTEPDQIKTVE